MGKEMKDTNPKNKLIQHWIVIAVCLAIFDAIAVNASYFLALWMRFDFNISYIPPQYIRSFLEFIPIYMILALIVHVIFKLYRSVWRFVGYHELLRCILATIVNGILHAVLITLIFGRMPITYYIAGALFQLIAVVVSRFFYKFILIERNRRLESKPVEKLDYAMIVGAGEAGRALLKDIMNITDNNLKVVCFIDDNENRWNRFVDGVPIVGGRDEIMAAVKKYDVDKIFITIPSTNLENRRTIANICSETDCSVMILPSLSQLAKGEIAVSHMRNVQMEDLLGRDEIRVNNKEIYEKINGKTVLITGGGGSIGSELSRQIASHNPKTLVIYDIYENNAYDIQQELIRKYPDLNLVVLIGSVRDSRRLDQVFSTYRPDMVFHAAAHKHVPLMEGSPCEAIKNNVIGTYKTAYMAMAYGCSRFVLISTDKAVNPPNIMGASKRVCEMIIQTMFEYEKQGKADLLPELFTHEKTDIEITHSFKEELKKAKTEFVAVRFGNVLGSNGSVVPLFKRQIAEGGPVTVTHPDIIRYFMTIPEAVSLVLQAATYAKGGEIFVLDMGEPVKIDALARNLIRYFGYRPDIDIKIEYTGLRPSEKMYEEKLMNSEGLTKTPNDLIYIGKPVDFDQKEFVESLSGLMDKAYINEEVIVRETTMKIVKKGGSKYKQQD